MLANGMLQWMGDSQKEIQNWLIKFDLLSNAEYTFTLGGIYGG